MFVCFPLCAWFLLPKAGTVRSLPVADGSPNLTGCSFQKQMEKIIVMELTAMQKLMQIIWV